MKIGVLGSNKVRGEEFKIESALSKIIRDTPYLFCILGGGGKGVPEVVKKFCSINLYDYIEFEPYSFLDKTVSFSNKFFFIRAKQIIDNSDYLFFVRDGKCKEVDYGIKYCQKVHKPYFILSLEDKSS